MVKKGAEGPLLMRESEEGQGGEIERGRAGGRDREKRDREMREEIWKEREQERRKENRHCRWLYKKQFSSERIN